MRTGGWLSFYDCAFHIFLLTLLSLTASTMPVIQYVYNITINTRVLIWFYISSLCSNIHCAKICQVYFTTWIPRSHFKLLCPKQNTEFRVRPFKFYPTRILILLYCRPTAPPAKTWASSREDIFISICYSELAQNLSFLLPKSTQTRHFFFLLLFFSSNHMPLWTLAPQKQCFPICCLSLKFTHYFIPQKLFPQKLITKPFLPLTFFVIIITCFLLNHLNVYVTLVIIGDFSESWLKKIHR